MSYFANEKPCSLIQSKHSIFPESLLILTTHNMKLYYGGVRTSEMSNEVSLTFCKGGERK